MASRTKNTQRNIVSGLIKQGVNIILPFIIRTIILYTLGELYQGISSLFMSILSVLNLADLGFSSVVVFSLYKPIAEKDYDSVGAILAFLKKIYLAVGTIILVAGLAVMPFLPHLIKGDYPADINIFILYVIYLLNATISYFFFAYKSALLIAMQRDDLVSNCSTISLICVRVVQIVILLVWRNYYAYAIMMPVCSVLNNLLLQWISKKKFPWIQVKGKIDFSLRKQMTTQIKGVVINKFADTARNSLDNIVLSAMLGLAVVAVYNNYYYIYSSLYAITLMVIHAMQASVGNSIATESIKKNYSDLRKFTFIFSYSTGWCSICMCCLYQPFMEWWMRGNEKMLLSDFNMILFCIYFYAINMNCTRNLYTNGNGLFWELRFIYIAEAVANVILNILLGKIFGVTGIILATIITIFVLNFICRTNILFKTYFKFSPKEFYLDHIRYVVCVCLTCAASFFACSFIGIGGFVGLLIRAGICIVIPLPVFILVEHKNKLFIESVTLLKHIIKK